MHTEKSGAEGQVSILPMLEKMKLINILVRRYLNRAIKYSLQDNIILYLFVCVWSTTGLAGDD